MSIQSKVQKLQETKSSHSSQDDPSYEKILEEAKINKICFSPDEPTYDFNKSYLEEIEIINSSNNVVKRFVHILSGNQLAIKQINIPHNRNNEKDYDKKLRQLIREIQSLNLLRDAPKVVQFYGACISEKQVWICMELMDMSLKDFYIKIHQGSKHFPEELIGYIVVDILDALEFCQQSKIMYRDIKPDNLMLKKSTGSTKYWPPERFTLEPYDVRSDVWSFGISLLETILGKYPYENINEEVKKNTIILQNLIKDTDPNRLVEMISNDYSKELEEFIGLCLKPLNERPAYEGLKKSEFYRRYANKTKEDVKRLIGHLNTTTSDYGTGSYYPNELDQNIESGSSEENTSEDSTQLGSGSSMEAYVKSECDYDLLEVDSEESTSSSSSSSSETSLSQLMKKSTSLSDLNDDLEVNLSEIWSPVNKMAKLAIDPLPGCQLPVCSMEEPLNERWPEPNILKKSKSTSNLTDTKLPDLHLHNSISLSTFEILRDSYAKWGEKITKCPNTNGTQCSGGDVDLNTTGNFQNQFGSFQQGQHQQNDPDWQSNNQGGPPPIPSNSRICVMPDCYGYNKSCSCLMHCPIQLIEDRVMHANIYLSMGKLCECQNCCKAFIRQQNQASNGPQIQTNNSVQPAQSSFAAPQHPIPQQPVQSQPYHYAIESNRFTAGPSCGLPSIHPNYYYSPQTSLINNAPPQQLPPNQGFASAMQQTYLAQSQQYPPNSGLISDTPIFAQSNQQRAHHYPQMTVQRTMVMDAQPFNSPAQNFHVQKSQVFGQPGSNVPVEQSYSVPRQNLAQNSRPTSGNVASPNQGAASSSNSSTYGADSMDTTNTNATRNNTKRPRNPIKRDPLKQRKHEQKHRDTKRIYLRDLQQTLQELINSHKELQKKVQEHIESQETNQRQILLTNQQILNILQQEQPSDGPISSQRMTTSLRINKVVLGASQTTGSNNRPRNIHASNNEPLNAQIGIQSNLQTTLDPRTSQIMHDNSYPNERSMSLDPTYITMSETASLGYDTVTPVNIDVEEFDLCR
uniref:mitogen-activated protein kinase kinase n=1 Tax=Acrobeloides nanus TaxID=290746 RepID=A0A914EIU8_9BILA